MRAYPIFMQIFCDKVLRQPSPCNHFVTTYPQKPLQKGSISAPPRPQDWLAFWPIDLFGKAYKFEFKEEDKVSRED